MNKRLVIYVMTFVSFTSTVYAQTTSSTVMPIVGAGGQGRIYGGGAGTYRQIEENVTRLAEKVLTEARITQTEDRNFVLAALAETHAAYVEYANLLISEKLLDMQIAGVRGNSVDLAEFMKVTAQIKAKKAAFDSLLTKTSSLNKGVLPSNYTAIVNADGTKQAVPSSGIVDMSSVVAKYNQLIQSELNPQLASFTAIKVDINGQVLTIKDYVSLLQPDFSKAPMLAPDKIDQMTTDMENLRKRSRAVGQKERVNFADSLRNEYNAFSRRFGSDYRYVARSGQPDKPWWSGAVEIFIGSDESNTTIGKGNTVAVPGVTTNTDVAARNNSFKRLIDVFYLRSYLRLTEGLQICALQPKMVQATNFGALQAIEALKELRSEPACGKEELEDALEYSRRILKYSGAQADEVFGKDGFMKAGLLNKLGSSVTFILGNRPSAEALHMLIQLVYADIQEELILATPGEGLQALRDMYVARYQSSEQQKSYYSKIKCSVDYEPSSCGQTDSFSETPGVGTEGDVRAIFIALKQKVALSKDLIDQANLINETLVTMRSARVSQVNTQNRKSKL